MKLLLADTRLVAIAVMLVAVVSYMLFLAHTWMQLQHDRSSMFEKLDVVLDRITPKPVNIPVTITDVPDAESS